MSGVFAASRVSQKVGKNANSSVGRGSLTGTADRVIGEENVGSGRRRTVR